MSTKIIVAQKRHCGEFTSAFEKSRYSSEVLIFGDTYFVVQKEKTKITQIVRELKLGIKKESSESFDNLLSYFYKLDSQEELWFLMWCIEAKGIGIVSDFQVHPDPYKISDKVVDGPTIIPKWDVGVDFRLFFYKNQYDKFKHLLSAFMPHNPYTTPIVDIDVKPSYQPMNSKKGEFNKNQAAVRMVYGKTINPVTPESRRKKNSKGQYITTPGFFQQTWVPEYCRYTPKTKELCKKWADCISIEEWLRKG